MKSYTVHCGVFGAQFDFSAESIALAVSGLPNTSFRESILRYKRPRQRWMSLLSRQLLLQGLGEENRLVDQKTVWSLTETGRPYLNSFPDFNISHSDKIAVCAISNNQNRVGIDIQVERPIGEHQLKLVLTKAELAWVGDSQAKATYLWSRKEAVSKLLGLGMRINYRNLEALSNQVRLNGNTYFLKSLPIARGYQCTLAADTPFTISVNFYNWLTLNQLQKHSSSLIHSAN
ncbi:4'-phosphopantetheinyl transferase superfamily protein [Neolewinella lacunae]|uniref:4'-phosphopantetheinyl transferase superfamily protein n=1 Tax=Neolewinella lacunae TaxID=1517758 RepID=A0A923PTP9_9BACT|nr:4'-phosphopantetheinyl transferase superfamily protein [Neolewinella lacunae]MBC6996637.1 4'-phosphopantetheinyl transferase superfamily protein [Neolewinella lacunae]MDN3634798.1 4'-phosphopantetheinyl transferase superfamily protein [Neolewinella lacunae]